MKDGTCICPYCDAILDESILGTLPPDHDEDTPQPDLVLPPATSSLKVRPKVRRAPVEDLPPRTTERTSGDEAPGDAWPSARRVASTARTRQASAGEQLFTMLGSGWAAFRRLQFDEQLTVAAVAGLCVMSLMPWRTTLAEGDETGLLSGGAVTFLLAGLAGVSIWARGSDKERLLPRRRWPLVAIGAGALSVAIGAIAAATSFERTMLAGQQFLIAWPGFGAYGALLGAAGIVLGGSLTLMRERQSELADGAAPDQK